MDEIQSLGGNSGPSLAVHQLGHQSAKAAFFLLRSHFRHWLAICILGFVLPFVIYDLWAGWDALSFAETIRGSLDRQATGISVEGLFGPGVTYLAHVLIVGFVLGIWWWTVYFLILRRTADLIANSDHKLRVAGIGDALKEALTRGVTYLVLVSFLLGLARSFMMVFFVLMCMSLIGPAVLVVGKNKVFSSIKQVVSLSFAKGVPERRWLILFQIVSYGGFLLAVLLLSDYLFEVILNFDSLVPLERSVFTTPAVDGAPWTWPYLAAVGIKSLLTSVAVCLYGIFSVIYYLQSQDLTRVLLPLAVGPSPTRGTQD